MVDKQHLFKLLVLKNKLNKFEKLGYFANKQTEVDNAKTILESDDVTIDLSKLDALFVNGYSEYIYSLIDEKNTQIIFEVSDYVSKKNLKLAFSSSNIPAVMIVLHF